MKFYLIYFLIEHNVRRNATKCSHHEFYMDVVKTVGHGTVPVPAPPAPSQIYLFEKPDFLRSKSGLMKFNGGHEQCRRR